MERALILYAIGVAVIAAFEWLDAYDRNRGSIRVELERKRAAREAAASENSKRLSS